MLEKHGNHLCICLYELTCSRHFREMELYKMQSSVIDCFHSAYSQDSSILWYISLLHSLYGWIIFHCMIRPQCVYIFIIWVFELFIPLTLQKNMISDINIYVQDFIWKCFHFSFISFLHYFISFPIYLWVEYLVQMVILEVIFWGNTRLFSNNLKF